MPQPSHKPTRRRRRRIGSYLYHASFGLFLLILGALLVGSAWGLGEQAWRTDHQRRWNMFALIAAYIALGLISLIVIWSRVLSVKKFLRTMPKPYIPIRQVDVSKKVANHVAREYARTSVIAHISQASTSYHEGWGAPGTRWENVHYRSFILATVPAMREILCPGVKGSPLSTAQLIDAADTMSHSTPSKPDPLRVFVASYTAIIDRALFARSEPSEVDAAAVEKVMALVRNLVEVKREKHGEI